MTLLRRVCYLSFLIVNPIAMVSGSILPFQGVLTTPQGEVVDDGVHVIRFRLFDEPLGGEVLWGGESHRASVQQGLVNVVLGTVNPMNFGAEVFEGAKAVPMYLQITVDSDGDGLITEVDPPLLPRQAVVPTMFARVSSDSRRLEGWGWDRILGNDGGVRWNALGDPVRDRILALEAEIEELRNKVPEIPVEPEVVVPSVLYVDPVAGDNANDGTEVAPLRNLGYAIDSLPKLLPHNVTIFLSPGDYEQAVLIDGIQPRHGQGLRIESAARSSESSYIPDGVRFIGGSNIIVSQSTGIQFFGITFQPDSGFGVFVPLRSTVSFTSCRFVSHGGIAVRRWSHAFLSDCTFDGSSHNGWRGVELQNYASVLMHAGTAVRGYETGVFAYMHSAALWAENVATRERILEGEVELYTGSIYGGARDR